MFMNNQKLYLYNVKQTTTDHFSKVHISLLVASKSLVLVSTVPLTGQYFTSTIMGTYINTVTLPNPCGMEPIMGRSSDKRVTKTWYDQGTHLLRTLHRLVITVIPLRSHLAQEERVL